MNKKLKLKLSDYFFVISCSVIIFIFSLSISFINHEIGKYKVNNPKYNKQVTLSEESTIYLNDLYQLLKEENITIKLKKYRKDNMIVETYLNINENFYIQDILEGEMLSMKNFRDKSNFAVFSNTFNGEKTLEMKNAEGAIDDVTLKEIGKVYSNEGKMIISNELFNEFLETKNLTREDVIIVLSGEEKEIESCINLIKNEFLNSGEEIKVNDYFTYDTSSEWTTLIFSLVLLFLITFSNTIGISYFLVKNIEKEIIVKKIVGATNFSIAKEFFAYFNKITLVSLVIAITSHFIVSLLTKGYLGNMNISISIINLFVSFIFIIIFSIISIIPFLIYIMKIKPVVITRRS
ncbi:MAG: hypothetical protein ACRDCW_17535 [Sarcina sp.]